MSNVVQFPTRVQCDLWGRTLLPSCIVFAMESFCGMRPDISLPGQVAYEVDSGTQGLYEGPASGDEDLALVSFEGLHGTTLPCVVVELENLTLVR